MKHTFVVEGDPVGKGRPRFTRQGRAYTPAKTKEYEKRVKDAYIESGGPDFGEQALILRVNAIMQMPKSWSNKKRKAMTGTPCLKRLDCDNVLKSIQDSLREVAYQDDSYIYDCGCIKTWGEIGSAVVVLMTPEGLQE